MIKVFPLDFMGQGALLQPKDQKLHDMAVDFCTKELADEVNLSTYSKVFIAADEDHVEGITGYTMRPDISLYRTISARANAKLHHRWHTYFADNGILGYEVLLHISGKDSPEQRCVNWEQELKAAKAVPADRYLIKVRAF